jgi:hypothetical protein
MLPTPIVQLPPPYQTATANAPGAESVAHFSKTEALPLPAVITSDKAKLDGLSPGGWIDKAAKAMALAAPGVTITVPIDLRNLRTATALEPSTYSGGGVVPGGGVVFQGAGMTLTPGPIVDNGLLVPWAFRVRAAIPVPVSLKYLMFGMMTDVTHGLFIVDQYGYSDPAKSNTQLGILQSGGASTAYAWGSTGYVIDGAYHDFMIAYDVTNIKMYVDDNLIISVPGTFPSTPLSPGFNVATADYFAPFTDAAYAV